jgi:hypothetical protein
MKLKRIKSVETKLAWRNVKNLSKQLDILKNQHDCLTFVGTADDLADWLDGLSIKNLQDLKDIEDGKKIRISKSDLIKKSELRKAYERMSEQLSVLEVKAKESELDDLLSSIKNIIS